MKRIAHLGEARPGGYQRGIAFGPDGTLYANNTGARRIEIYAPPDYVARRDIAVQGDWAVDLVVDGGRLYVTLGLSGKLQVYDAATGAVLAQASSGGQSPGALLIDSGKVYVANQGGARGQPSSVDVFEAQTLALLGSYPVGKNPAALAIAPDHSMLYIAASDDDWVDRIDLVNHASLQPLQLMQPGAEGEHYSGLAISPNALALSPDGARLYVSAAMLNAIFVLDTRTGLQLGALPTGFRPTALIAQGNALYIANSKGQGTVPDQPGQDSSNLPRGTLQKIEPVPEGAALEQATLAVAQLNGLPRREYTAPEDGCARVGPLPAQRGGDPALSRIHHVIYVLKENKTFDSVFGDFPGAAGSTAFLEWGERVTPNQHQLARQFCLADTYASAFGCGPSPAKPAPPFYLESEQSAEGHYRATAQATTDYFERTWMAPWGRGVLGPVPLVPAGFGPLDTPRAGFLFDSLARAQVAYRSYGEFVGIAGDLSRHIESTFITLQYDHTFGLQPGRPAPDSMVADNDVATGQLVDAVSHSSFWSDTLILITEDDPSGSGDHLDSHRSFALVVSPWARRGRVSHVRGSFPSLAATAERALGVAPVSALDAQAEPLWDCLTGAPDATPYSALPGNVPMRLNPERPGARELDFSGPDRARLRLGIELWLAMRPGEPVPRQIAEGADDDDDLPR
jgi:DNA-binding beta-propeller fold protein YncE